jgi:hypothetical protein
MGSRGGCLRYVAQRFPPGTKKPEFRLGANAFLVATAVFSLLAWRGVLFPVGKSQRFDANGFSRQPARRTSSCRRCPWRPRVSDRRRRQDGVNEHVSATPSPGT